MTYNRLLQESLDASPEPPEPEPEADQSPSL